MLFSIKRTIRSLSSNRREERFIRYASFNLPPLSFSVHFSSPSLLSPSGMIDILGGKMDLAKYFYDMLKGQELGAFKQDLGELDEYSFYSFSSPCLSFFSVCLPFSLLLLFCGLPYRLSPSLISDSRLAISTTRARSFLHSWPWIRIQWSKWFRDRSPNRSAPFLSLTKPNQ